MSTEENRTTVLEILSDLFDYSPADVEGDIELASIDGWSSLNRVRLISAIENEYDIEFVPDDMLSFSTLHGVVQLITDKR